MAKSHYIPSKSAIISGLMVFALGVFIINKVPKVKALLGGV